MGAKESIVNAKTALGIEFGSTRIKAVLIDENNQLLAMGDHGWENKLENGVWTYSLEDIWSGLQDCYQSLAKDVQTKYQVELTGFGSIGFSGMMHGYLAFNEAGELLVPFRTWRNTITEEAAQILSKEFAFNIPQRWSISHLYQSILNKEEHVKNVSFFTTLAGYVHWKLTGEKVLGVGEASGMFPIDSKTRDFNRGMIEQFNQLKEVKSYAWKLEDILPKVLVAGDYAGKLTNEGAKLLDPTGKLAAGIPMCPPEGDAGTGMVGTNSTTPRTGNVSAGTSVFSMFVLEQPLNKPHEEIDVVTTPSGEDVAMVHCNNCTSDLNAWVNLFKESMETMGMTVDMNELYGNLYRKALEGDADCGGLLAYNYFSGEAVTGFNEGRPLFVREENCTFNLANFMRTHLMSALATLKVGMDILLEEENVKVDSITGHGGLFKTPVVGQRILAGAINAPITVMDSAGEGGAWGMALLASYMVNKKDGQSLDAFLADEIFAGQSGTTIAPVAEDVAGMKTFTEKYKEGFAIERAAVEHLK